MNGGLEEVEECREAEVEPAVVEVPENGWEDFLFLVLNYLNNLYGQTICINMIFIFRRLWLLLVFYDSNYS